MEPNYLEELNESQRAAVLYNDGPLLVIAGAGSGKTRVLTYKIAYLLGHGYAPWNILALTFTNKAAREMKERIARQVGAARARSLWMGTFHSIFLRILQVEAEVIGFPPRFTIYDAADSKSLLRTLIKEMQLDEKVYRPGAVQARISGAKNRLISPAQYAADASLVEADRAARMPLVFDLYTRYTQRCRQAGAMDFDDLLVYTHQLFGDHPEVLARYREQFGYILVDEYQDTNLAQHAIVMQLAGSQAHLCVVGDDAQSIYSFRGANLDNILGFTRHYPRARVFKLEQNYRSTQHIVQAAGSLIAKNSRQIPKEVYSRKEEGEPLQVLAAYSDVEEGELVAGKLTAMKRANPNYTNSDFAILYRTNAQSRIFEEALRKRGIAYRIYGGLSFYQRKEIKDVVAYFRLTVNPADEEAFRRIINYPGRGIGEVTVGRLVEAAATHAVSVWRVLEDPLTYHLSVHKGTLEKLEAFRQLIAGFVAENNRKNAAEMGLLILTNSGIRAEVAHDVSVEGLSRRENIEELLSGMNTFCAQRLEEGDDRLSLSDFLSEISLLSDQDTGEEAEETHKVTLMTVHAAKGLEFKNVFVVGMEENLFPSGMCAASPSGLEEERRLLYVAITRAEEHCFLSYAKSRFRYGKTEFGVPSRFLKEIDARMPAPARQTPSFTPAARLRSVPVPAAASSTPPRTGETTLSAGDVLEHERFGIGDVRAVEGTGDNAKATIEFRHAGTKQLLLRFAKFKVISHA
jgi:DNA helicase-2/ATP-dependent DNA helicase PcrA